MTKNTRLSFARFTRFVLTFAVMIIFAIVAGVASAHNLQTKMVYMFFDPDTQAMLDDRIDGGGVHQSTIAGVYGDTGNFYSIDADTAYGSWQRYTGDDDEICGVIGAFSFAPQNKSMVFAGSIQNRGTYSCIEKMVSV
jgi:hypothetical protein